MTGLAAAQDEGYGGGADRQRPESPGTSGILSNVSHDLIVGRLFLCALSRL
jgi:hypothetical protein